jgi:hypothetical protein
MEKSKEESLEKPKRCIFCNSPVIGMTQVCKECMEKIRDGELINESRN